MTARLSWEIVKNSLVLTVKDGPKTSQYTISRTASNKAVGDILKSILKDLDQVVPPAPFGAVVEAPAPMRIAPAEVAPLAEAFAEATLEQEIRNDIPISEEESLAALKERAWQLAQQHAKFAEDEAVAERAMRGSVEYKGPASIPNVGITKDDVLGTTVDGTVMKVSDYREKPRFNTVNHED
jgi:hypothetical protein